ncbi:MAG TPA: SH3 domain-containing protein [Stackebrandtia sp.]|jgi:SH3-like domain-containing protein|uniref:SH3 domain-containing protein n=1 Tax=Stackebrandtia sp. TaxID=2023065 RepID=UPI002D468BC4|nr:SH3 domain-containing protein [Stackebrandtia sp.]HZE40946.1 SH3 domain-containing protein [Stackebrandtia sp.]
MKKSIRRTLLTTAAVAAVVAGGVTVTTVANADSVNASAACTAKGADLIDWPYYKAFKTTVNIRSGRSTNCVALGTGYTSHKVDIHCTSETGDWTYVRDVNTGVKGWVADKYLKFYDGRVRVC